MSSLKGLKNGKSLRLGVGRVHISGAERERGPLKKQESSQKDTWEYQENKRTENVYRPNERGDSKQRDGKSGVIRDDE